MTETPAETAARLAPWGSDTLDRMYASQPIGNAISNAHQPVDRERLARFETRAVPGQPRVRHGGPSRLEAWRALLKVSTLTRASMQAESDEWARAWGQLWRDEA